MLTIFYRHILNYLRLKRHGQLWEACLPKDPDRLAMLHQVSKYRNVHTRRERLPNDKRLRVTTAGSRLLPTASAP